MGESAEKSALIEKIVGPELFKLCPDGIWGNICRIDLGRSDCDILTVEIPIECVLISYYGDQEKLGQHQLYPLSDPDVIQKVRKHITDKLKAIDLENISR